MELTYNIRVEILPANVASSFIHTIEVEVTPAAVPAQEVEFNFPFRFDLSKIPINISEPIKETAFNFLSNILETYIDEDRELKTLLNFGEDRQNVIISQRTSGTNASGVPNLQFKLLQPVSSDIEINTPAFISVEVANTIIQSSRIALAPPLDRTPYLRPRNTDIKVGEELGRSLKNVTLEVLNLRSGSLGTEDASKNISFEDEIFRRWYSYDFNSAELNINFTDYNNFIFYGSATMRLQAFRQKLLEIQRLTDLNKQFSGNIFTGSLATAGASYILEQSAKISQEKENIIRSFDRYEQFLYFTPSGSNLPYSASAWYAEGSTEYNQLSYWPKTSNNLLYSIDSQVAKSWFEEQIQIAQRFDEFNENNLINTIPTHIREHEENSSYFTFIAMIGHFFDTIKPYVDQFPEIFNRYINPNENLSKDLVANIAESVGFKLPTIDSVFNLAESVLGTTEKEPRRDFTTEAYKRLLHNLPLFAKSKGTKTALRSALRTLGITEELIDIQESGKSDETSYRLFSENYNLLNFEGSQSYVEIPISSSLRTPSPRTMQLGVSIFNNKNMTLLNGDDLWKLDVKVNPLDNKKIRFEIVDSSSNELMATDYFNNNTFSPINLSIQTYATDGSSTLRAIRVYREDLEFDIQSTDSNQFINLWDDTQILYIGGSGSIITDNFEGNISDIKVWGINLLDKNIINAAFDPASNAGNLFSDPIESLYIHLPLNKINLSLLENNQQLLNETPYLNKNESPSLEFINVEGIVTSSIGRDVRYITQKNISTGFSGTLTNKIKIAPPPVFIEESGSKRLYRDKSIVSVKNKTIAGNNKVVLATSPTTLINQNIIRNMGLENINSLYGIPNSSYITLPNSLTALRKYYNKFYYINVDKNKFIRNTANIFSTINQIIDYFIPSRANALVGVVIEPTVLERTRIPLVRNIKLYGLGSRRTTKVLENPSQNTVDYSATFTLSENISLISNLLSGSFDTIDINIKAKDDEKLISTTSALDAKTANSISTISSLTAKFVKNVELVKGSLLKIKTNIKPLIYSIEGTSSPLFLQIKKPVEEIKANTSLFDVKIIEPLNNVSSISIIFGGTISRTENNVNVDYKLIDRQHLSANITSVIKSFKNKNNPDFATSKELISKFPRKYLDKASAINLNLNKMDKFKFSLGAGLGLPNAEPYNKVYTRKLFEYEILRPRSGGITSLTRRGLYAIPPSCDLENYGSRNYFIQDFGVYYFSKIIKTPIYSNPLSVVWNQELQDFENVPEWRPGNRYKENDVVIQNIDITLNNILGETRGKAARKGNGKYYVFKTKPTTVSQNSQPYKQKIGESFFTEDVPSPLPPSLDKSNWARLRFLPKKIPNPRRVVFDTFTIPEPKLNDFKTTTVDVSRRIDLPQRFIDSFSIGTISATQSKRGKIKVQNISALFATQVNGISISSPQIRLRLYKTDIDRELDFAREIDETPAPNSGLLLDLVFNNFGVIENINPVVSLVTDLNNFDGELFYTMTNLSNVSVGRLNLFIYYFAIDVEPRLPIGYLKKHYKFFRDNSTATKRRNYLGCKNTPGTTVDGRPPVEIFISEGTELVVDPGIENNEIRFGKGSILS
jgi:hypothetical protein